MESHPNNAADPDGPDVERWLLCDDLMFGSRVTGESQRLGISLKTASGTAQLLREISAACRIVAVDLSCSALKIADLLPALREAAPQARIIAFGNHVQTGRLQAARDAGCDEVLARGQFLGNMTVIK